MRAWVSSAILVVLAVACGGAPPPVPSNPTTAHPPERGATVDLGGGARGYFVDSEKKDGKRPAVIVIQEWWGLDDWIKRNTERFAAQGYVALAIDLYRGRSAKDPGEAHELMRGLPEDRAAADLAAAFAWLAARPDVDPARIGSVGWCMGGGYSLALATTEPRLRAAVINYGRLVTSAEKVDAIKASLLGNFAGADRGIAPDDVRAFEGQMRQRQKDVDIKIYDGAGHAFMNPGNAQGYDEKATHDAWARIDAFLAKTLKP